MHLTNKRRWLASALATAALGAGALAPAADADFDPAFQDQCTGTDIAGQGATFQAAAQAAWTAGFVGGVTGLSSPVCPNFSFDDPPTTAQIGYGATGSGAGRTALQNRTADRFGAFDQAPSQSQLNQINAGPTNPPVATDNAQLRSIPVTQGAVTISVNFPDGCGLDPDLDFPSSGGDFARFVVLSSTWEEVFYADDGARTWGALMPGITGDGCADRKILRAVRSDSSGTTFLFKQWLARVGVNSDYWTNSANNQNTTWPNDSGVNPASASPVLRFNGNANVANGIRANDGSIGYVDLADARQRGFDKTGFVPGGTNTTPAADDTYWVPVQNGAGRTQEPTANVNGYRDASTNPATNRGANCSRVTYDLNPITGQADPTIGSGFNQVLGVNSRTGYGICGLSYAGLWDDACDAYGNSDTEQAKARSVFDYFDYIVGGFGQQVAQRADYAVLPPNILTIAQDAVASVGWNKPGNTCTGA